MRKINKYLISGNTNSKSHKGVNRMDQLRQLQDNIRQARQTMNQLNQQLMNTERLAQNISSQFNQNQFQGQPTGYGQQFGGNQYGQGSQYNPYASGNNPTGQYNNQNFSNEQNINPISGLSENKPTMRQQSGVNKYGAKYSSGNDLNEDDE